MRGADGEARPALVQQIEIDEIGERPLQRHRRIVAGVIGAKRIGIAGMRQRIGPEEAGDAVGDRGPVRKLFVEAGNDVAKAPDRMLLHLLPELAQARQTVLRRVARDQAGIDRADRGADNPVRLDAGFMQRLVDAGLIGAKRAAALQHQHDLPGVGFAERPHVRSITFLNGVHLPLPVSVLLEKFVCYSLRVTCSHGLLSRPAIVQSVASAF
jgi:hypothetical protein